LEDSVPWTPDTRRRAGNLALMAVPWLG
jgi:hypothetical protein